MGSEPSLYSEQSRRLTSLPLPIEPPSRRLPQLAARRSAVLRARLAACRAPCAASKAPPSPAGPPRKAAARRTSGSPGPPAGPPPQQQARFGLDGPRCPISPRYPTEDSKPVLGPCARPNPEAEAEAEAKSRRGPRLLRAKTSDPHINRVFTASGGGNTRGSQRHSARPWHGLAYVEANPRQCRAHATPFGQRRLRFAGLDGIGCSQSHGSAAACSRLRHVPSAAGSCTGGTRLQHRTRGCNTLCC